MTAPVEAAIRIRDLCVSLGRTDVLHAITAAIPARRITVLFGFSGSGKTTLLRCLNRLNDEIPQARVSGRVEINLDEAWFDAYDPGVEVAYLRRRVGMLFQDPNPLPTTIRRNIMLPLSVTTALPEAERNALVESSLRSTGLWDEVADRLDTPALQLSGGQQQRLCLARTLALAPQILLLDEPTSSLDFRAAKGIEDLILTLANTYTLVLVSHDPVQTHRLADRVLLLNEGRLAGTIERSDFGDVTAFRERLEAILRAGSEP